MKRLLTLFCLFGLIFSSCKEEEVPEIALKDLKISPTEEFTLAPSGTKQLTLVATPSKADVSSVVWKTSNLDVATVENGLVEAIAEGTATITANVNGVIAQAKVTVDDGYNPVVSVSIEPTTAFTMDRLTNGEFTTKTLAAKVYPEDATNATVVWDSSDKEVATISEEGVITAHKSGVTLISATAEEITSKIQVTVEGDDVRIKNLSIQGGGFAIVPGSTKQLTAILDPENVTDNEATWSSADETIATVSESGLLEAKSIGSTTITVEVDGTTASISVTVSYNLVGSMTFTRNTTETKNIEVKDENDVIKNLLAEFRRCLVKRTGDGEVTIAYLDDSNSNKYADGTTDADLTGADGDVMVYFPEFWYVYSDNGSSFTYTISKAEIAGGVHVTESLVGAYKAFCDANNALFSWSGITPSLNINDTAKTKDAAVIKNRGTGYQIIDYNQHCTIAMMLYARYQDRNIQEHLGQSGAKYGTASTFVTGYTNELGVKDSEGETKGFVNGLGLEGVYGGCHEQVAGVSIYTANISAENYQLWTITEPGTTTKRTVQATRLDGTGAAKGALITKMQLEDGPYFDMIPTDAEIITSPNSCLSDYADRYAIKKAGSSNPAYRSGSDNTNYVGIAAISTENTVTGKNVHTGTRLAFRGKITVIEDAATFKSTAILEL